jgi:LmbE family N-acetylglucosaminyl deacetylase
MSTILLVLAHPDDESFVGGGSLCLYGRHGLRTALLCVTDGQAGRLGVRGEPPLATRETVAAVRRAELERAASILEIRELITPGWMDGKLHEVPDSEGVQLVRESIARLHPEILVTFGPEGGASGHPDHKAVGRWTTRAFRETAGPGNGGPRKLYWITWPSSLDHLRNVSGAPITTTVELGAAIVEAKRCAFQQHRTQQDFRKIYGQIIEGFGSSEYFHLAESQVGEAPEVETDLLAGLEKELSARRGG